MEICNFFTYVYTHKTIYKCAGISLAGPNEYAYISRKNIAEMKGLLTRAYNEIYAPVYPLSKGGDPLQEWLDKLERPDGENDVRILIAGKNLSGDAPVLKGMTMSIYYNRSDTGVLSFIVTEKKFRNEGLGKKLTFMQADFLLAAAKEAGRDLRGWYIECHDPAKTNKNYDGFDSRKLVEKYVSWGAKPVPVDYILPVKDKSPERVNYYMLLSAPHPKTGCHPDSEVTLEHIRSTYRDYGVDPETDPSVRAMEEQLEQSERRKERRRSEIQPEPPSF